VVGVDISIQNLRIAKRHRRIDLILATATRLPLRNNIFHKVAMLELIEHLQNHEVTSLDEVNRVLRPGGCVLLSTPNKGMFSLYLLMDPATYLLKKHRHFYPIEVRRLLAAARFERIRVFTAGFFAEQTSYLIGLFVTYIRSFRCKGLHGAVRTLAFSGLSARNLEGQECTESTSILLQKCLRFFWRVADLEFVRGERALTDKYYCILATARKGGCPIRRL